MFSSKKYDNLFQKDQHEKITPTTKPLYPRQIVLVATGHSAWDTQGISYATDAKREQPVNRNRYLGSSIRRTRKSRRSNNLSIHHGTCCLAKKSSLIKDKKMDAEHAVHACKVKNNYFAMGHLAPWICTWNYVDIPVKL